MLCEQSAMYRSWIECRRCNKYPTHSPVEKRTRKVATIFNSAAISLVLLRLTCRSDSSKATDALLVQAGLLYADTQRVKRLPADINIRAISLCGWQYEFSMAMSLPVLFEGYSLINKRIITLRPSDCLKCYLFCIDCIYLRVPWSSAHSIPRTLTRYPDLAEA